MRQALVILWGRVRWKLVSGMAEPKVEPGQMEGQNRQVCRLQQSRAVRVDDVSGPRGAGGEGGSGVEAGGQLPLPLPLRLQLCCGGFGILIVT